MMRSLAAGLGALAATLLPAAGFAAAPEAFIAPGLGAFEVVALQAPAAKLATTEEEPSGRLRVGTVRALAKASPIVSWVPISGGYVTRLRSASAGAQGLRVKLELGTVPGPIEARVAGPSGRVEAIVIDPFNGPEAWTPWTEGESQDIELFSAIEPSPGAVRVAGIVHFDTSPFAKAAAASCTLSTACSSGDAALDAAINERKKSLFKIQYIVAGKAYVCSATLIDTPRKPAAYALTANHCIDNDAAARSITSFWFYEASSCASAAESAATVQQAGGAQLTFTNYNLDGTLLLLNTAPPAGALYSPVNAALLAKGESVVSLSHPRGDTSRWATGAVSDVAPDGERPYWMYVVNYTRGIIEPGSSGSGLFTMSGGRLALRGFLSQGAVDLTCTNANAFTLYGRLEAFYPEIGQYIGATSANADDAPNRPQDFATLARDPNGTDATPLNARTTTLQLDNRRIEYAGDVDLYRFTLTAPAYVSAWTEGAMDTVGTFLKADGSPVAETDTANDDADWVSTSNYNFGLTRRLTEGTYFVHVANFVPTGVGSYNLRLRADTIDTNYTDLWWNSAEIGWGVNINHQGTLMFATLFTYDAGGEPMWLVMSRGELKADGAYSGTLYRTTGTRFDAAFFAGASTTEVGTMRIAFNGANSALMTYTIDGVSVSKVISREVFGTPPTCTWSAFERRSARNYQDLWFNSAEPGWGLNISHQGTKMFATLFAYGSDGRGMWLVMSEGARNATGAFTGTLYRTRGPAFNAAPWTPASVTPVGTMTLDFTHGNAARLTYTVDGVMVSKQIERQTFGGIKTYCNP